ncbi:MAG: TIGR03087 family PEP-CTERM/XrtA system glycosyltransferase [Anaerolineae bacterium]|nr:TIGR03087 family PEP-CTERM/XrtA system glycosyltransferase [Anaerolineae bacterium]
MRILCLTPRLPYPPDRGDRLRAFNVIKRLSGEHELHLLSFIASDDERQYVAALEPFCRSVEVVPLSQRRSAAMVALNAWRRLPLQALYYRSTAMQQAVDEALRRQRFDAAYIHLFRMAPYLSERSDLYRIVDLTDVISSELARSMAYRGAASRLVYGIERPRIARYEREVAQRFEEVWLVSDHDRQLLAAECPDASIRVVPNGVDFAAFYPTGQPAEPNSLLFTGHMRVFHNIDAATFLVQEILPLVRRQIPDCTLMLAGADPGPEVQALAAEPGVTVAGFVPDLNGALNDAAVFVAPLRFAAGVQNKVLEAMAAGRPVVTTSVVNQGLGAQPGRDLLIADDTGTIANQIVALLQDADLASRVAQAGRAFVTSRFSWDAVSQRMQVVGQQVRQTRTETSR